MTKKTQGEVSSYSYSRQLVVLIILCCLLGLYLYRHYFPLWSELRIKTDIPIPSIAIEIGGEVSNPGIYFFCNSPTVTEALATCGETIDSTQIIHPGSNCKLATGTSLWIVKAEEGVKIDLFPMASEKKILFGIPLNLNTANAEELSNIPGVGPKIAWEIVTYRNKTGYFPKIEDIKKVKGIGDKKFIMVQNYLTVTVDIP
jgi:competence protein ComEA